MSNSGMSADGDAGRSIKSPTTIIFIFTEYDLASLMRAMRKDSESGSLLLLVPLLAVSAWASVGWGSGVAVGAGVLVGAGVAVGGCVAVAAGALVGAALEPQALNKMTDIAAALIRQREGDLVIVHLVVYIRRNATRVARRASATALVRRCWG